MKKRGKKFIVVVGKSGAGKSTFIQAIGLPKKYHCVLSRPMVEYLKQQGKEINHNNIHKLARGWYRQDHYWQVKYLINQSQGKDFLIIDGLRYAFELEYLRKCFPDLVVVIKIIATPEIRYQRLRKRKKIPINGWEEFLRLEHDESQDMDLEILLDQADFAVENMGSLRSLRRKAQEFVLSMKLTKK